MILKKSEKRNGMYSIILKTYYCKKGIDTTMDQERESPQMETLKWAFVAGILIVILIMISSFIWFFYFSSA